MKIPVAGFLLLALARTGAACDGLAVESGWVRQPPPGAMMTAAYARLVNRTRRSITIERLASPQFGEVELHRTVLEGGVSHMRPALPLSLAPGAVQSLEPGGYHLMLSDPVRELRQGDPVIIRFQCGPTIFQVPFAVRTDAP